MSWTGWAWLSDGQGGNTQRKPHRKRPTCYRERALRRARDSERTARGLKVNERTEGRIDLSMPDTPRRQPHRCHVGLAHRSTCLVVRRTSQGKLSKFRCNQYRIDKHKKCEKRTRCARNCCCSFVYLKHDWQT